MSNLYVSCPTLPESIGCAKQFCVNSSAVVMFFHNNTEHDELESKQLTACMLWRAKLLHIALKYLYWTHQIFSSYFSVIRIRQSV